MKNSSDTGVQVAKILFTVLFGIVYFFFLNVSLILIVVKLSLTSELFKDIFTYTTNSYSIVEENALAYVSPYDKDLNDEINTYLEENPNATDDFEKTLEDALAEYNIPKDVLDYIEDDEETIELASDIISGYLNYTMGVTDNVYFPKKDIEKALEKTIDRYERKTGDKVDTSKLSLLLDDVEDEYITYLENNTDDEMRNLIHSILNGFVFYIIIAITIFSFLMIIVLNVKNKKTYLTLGILHMGVAVTYYSIASVIETQFEEARAAYTLLQNVMKVSYGVFGIGFVGLVIFAILTIIERKGAQIHA